MPPSPIQVATSLNFHDILRQLRQNVNRMESTELERIRLEIRSEFYSGVNSKLWRSAEEFGEEMFPEESAVAARNLTNRLLNHRYGIRYGPTRQTIVSVAQQLGIPAEDRLHNASAMTAKRELTVRTVFPHFGTAWGDHYGSPLSLPYQPKGDLRPELAVALSKAGMPAPEQFHSESHFQDEIAAVREDVPTASDLECTWAALWRMMRPFLPGFDRRLWLAARQAIQRKDGDGEELKRHLERVGTVLRAVRHAGKQVSQEQQDATWVLETAAARLSERHGLDLTAEELIAFLHARNATIQAIQNRTVGSGWLIWHDPDVRGIAHRLLRR